MSKFIIILGIFLGFFVFGLLGYLSYKNNSLNTQIARLKEDLANRDTLIEVQNAQIQKNALDVQTYKSKRQESDTQIITKYQNVYVRDESCAKELESIKKLMETFYETSY